MSDWIMQIVKQKQDYIDKLEESIKQSIVLLENGQVEEALKLLIDSVKRNKEKQ